MTNDSQITQCPKCDTTFRITPAQLKVAKGAVRCGACLHVFRASDHFQAPKKAEPEKTDDRTADMFGTEATPQESAEIITPDDEVIIDDDNGLIDDDDDDFLIDDDNGLIDDDLGVDDKSNHIGELNEEFLSLDTDDLSDPFFNENDKHQNAIKAEHDDDDEAWAQSLLDDSDDEPEPVKAKPKKAKIKTNNSGDTKANAANFSYIQEDPLDLALPEKRSKLPFVLWSLASLILLGALTGQAAYFNFDQWARYDQYRPYYQLACEQLGCTLPSTYDLSRIRTTASPQVSSHPKYKNALTVDILFMNDALYEQAFPRLEVSFSNSNDKVIANRLFSPDEYLAGEAAGLSLMPVQTPIHIAIEIQDPGKQASNYQVRFLAP